MKMLKKLGALLLATVVAIGSIAIAPAKVEAATACEKVIKIGVTYRYDIDGDGDKDKIKAYKSGDNLMINVNGCVKKAFECFTGLEEDVTVKIYDFNKNDKSKEIVCKYKLYAYTTTRIMKFRNSTCKVNKIYRDMDVYSYSPSTGIVTFDECYDGSRYAEFSKAIGCYNCYSKVKVNGYTFTNQYTANTDSYVRKNKYIAAKTLTAYTTATGTKKAFTISKGQSAYVYALYKNGTNKRIKVKNKYGKYGYVKIGSSLLFKESSCLWFR